jgi:hypothetical protein
MAWFPKKSEPLSPPLSIAPPGPTPCPPSLFLGASEWFVENCGDVLRNDLVFSTNAQPIHPQLEGKIEDLQLPILNFLNGKDVLNLSRALRGGSKIVSLDEIIERGNANSFIENVDDLTQPLAPAYRGVVTTDDWFDVDPEYRQIANNLFDTLRDMYDAGCSVVVASTMGVYSVPRQLCTIFNFESQWKLAFYTKKNISTTQVGSRILGDSFPFQKVYRYTKSHFISAPQDECLFVEFIDPADYEDSDSDGEDDPVPEPNTDSPVVVHFGAAGGCISYFGFVNSLDVSYGAIMLRLVNAAHYNHE